MFLLANLSCNDITFTLKNGELEDRCQILESGIAQLCGQLPPQIRRT